MRISKLWVYLIFLMVWGGFSKNQRLYFFYIDQIRPDGSDSRKIGLSDQTFDLAWICGWQKKLYYTLKFLSDCKMQLWMVIKWGLGIWHCGLKIGLAHETQSLDTMLNKSFSLGIFRTQKSEPKSFEFFIYLSNMHSLLQNNQRMTFK